MCIELGYWDDDDRTPLKDLETQSNETFSDTEYSVRDRVSAAQEGLGWRSRCCGTDLEFEHNYNNSNTVGDEVSSGTDSDRESPFWNIRHRLYESSDSWEMHSGDSWISDSDHDSDSQSSEEYLAI